MVSEEPLLLIMLFGFFSARSCSFLLHLIRLVAVTSQEIRLDAHDGDFDWLIATQVNFLRGLTRL